MSQAVSYAYEQAIGERPSLFDQFAACRAYAEANAHTIVGEFNDIDMGDHPNQRAGIEAIRSFLATDPTTVVLIYKPDSAASEQFAALGATVEAVSPLVGRTATA
jgi:hypothetical protein